jgi:hypothetical protein
MADEAQIGCYLLRAEADALTAYARSLELSRPKLCALLVLRAVRAPKLAVLYEHQRGSESKRGAVRVTTRVDDHEVKRRFATAAAAAGLGSDDAAAIVFRAELDERWLENAIVS